MNVFEIIIIILAAIVSFGWAFGVRRYVRTGHGVMQQTVNTTMLFVISTLLVLSIGWSPYHLLWMFPVSWLFGTLSFVFPFSLLSIPGRWFGQICCVGLEPKQKDDW